MAQQHDLINNHIPGHGTIHDIYHWLKKLRKPTVKQAELLFQESPHQYEIKGFHNILQKLFQQPARAPEDMIILSPLELYILTERLLARVIFVDAMRQVREVVSVILLYGAYAANSTLYDLNTWKVMIGDHDSRPIPPTRFNYKNPTADPDTAALDEWRSICIELQKPQADA